MCPPIGLHLHAVGTTAKGSDVIHGHGGSGVTIAFGCAEEIVALAAV